MRKPPAFWQALPLALSTACTGTLGQPAGADAPAAQGDASGAGPGRSDSSLVCTEPAVGATPLRRLTRVQYTRTIRDLLGEDVAADAFPADDNMGGFEVGLSVSPLLVEEYGRAAKEIAARVPLSRLTSCDVSAQGEDACAREFIASFARRAFRRSASDEERQTLLASFRAGRDAAGYEQGLRLLVEGVLQSPSFVYHVEDAGAPDEHGLAQLSPFAVANRLSYLVWGSMPDDALLDAAEQKQLASPASLRAQAQRMMQDRPEAVREGFREFARQWLSLSELDTMKRDPERFPDFSADTAAALRASLERQIDHVVWEQDGSLSDLFLGRTMFVNAELADIFGVGARGAALVAQEMPAQQRRGILTHPALLAILSTTTQSNPVIRGKFVRERLLCQTLPEPPNDAAVVAPDPRPGASTRERFAEHSSDQACAGCHRLLDPVGFGLENFDALGAFRTLDEGMPVDASGEVVASADADGPFEGAIELAERLAGSDEVRNCVATQYFRFAIQRTETRDDACSLESVHEGFEAAGSSISELILAVVQTDAFRLRKAP